MFSITFFDSSGLYGSNSMVQENMELKLEEGKKNTSTLHLTQSKQIYGQNVRDNGKTLAWPVISRATPGWPMDPTWIVLADLDYNPSSLQQLLLQTLSRGPCFMDTSMTDSCRRLLSTRTCWDAIKANGSMLGLYTVILCVLLIRLMPSQCKKHNLSLIEHSELYKHIMTFKHHEDWYSVVEEGKKWWRTHCCHLVLEGNSKQAEQRPDSDILLGCRYLSVRRVKQIRFREGR